MTTAAARPIVPRRPRPTVLAYAALWVGTAAGALLAATRRLDLTSGTPRDALPATVDIAVDLAAHNALVALWPIALVAVGWPAIPIVRSVGDVLVAGQLAGHGLLVGSALGAHPDLWRYLPHLPVEWLALAVPAAAWIIARRDEPVHVVKTVLLTGLLVVGAALVETYAVPI